MVVAKQIANPALGRQYKIRCIAAIGYKAKGDEVRISGSAAKVTFDIVIP